MSASEPREGRCWLIAHRWSRWKDEGFRDFPGFQIKTCLRCGRRRRRWLG